MTALATIHKRRFIVMAAGSRVSSADAHDSQHATSAQRLFLVSTLKVGISAVGHGTCSDTSLNELLQDFSKSSGLGNENCFAVALSLGCYLEDHHADLDATFNVCGFDGSLPEVVEIGRTPSGRWKVRRVNRCEEGTIVESLWASDGTSNLHDTEAVPDFSSMSTMDAITFLERFFLPQKSNCSARRLGRVDILVLTPERNFFVKASDLSLAVI